MSGCSFCRRKIDEVDYKDVASLRDALKKNGSLRPARTSRLCRRHQAQLARAVKRARFLGLLPLGRSHRIIPWPPKRGGGRR